MTTELCFITVVVVFFAASALYRLVSGPKQHFCGDFHGGWHCNRYAYHEGVHRYHDPGTGRGDDKIVEW